MSSLICIFAKIFNRHRPLTSLNYLIKMQTHIQTNIHFQISVIIVGNLYLEDILDAILNF